MTFKFTTDTDGDKLGAAEDPEKCKDIKDMDSDKLGQRPLEMELSPEIDTYLHALARAIALLEMIKTLPELIAERDAMVTSLKGMTADAFINDPSRLARNTAILKRIIAMIEEGGGSRPKRARRQRPKSPEQTDYYNTPTSQTLNLIYNELTNADNLQILADRLAARDSRVAARATSGKPGIMYIKNGGSVQVTINGLDKLGSNKGVGKIFTYFLIKINEQAYHGGEITREYIEFPIQDLVNNGHYADITTAYHGLEHARRVLRGLEVAITQPARGRKTVTGRAGSSGTEPLFGGSRKTGGTFRLVINAKAPWDLIFAYFTILPRYYFKLPARAAFLLQKVFGQARQNIDVIAAGRPFIIGIQTIQMCLGLPPISATIHPRRDIIDEIKNAIDAINDMETQTHDSAPCLLITPRYSGDSVQDYMRGALQIQLQGAYRERFITLAGKKAKKVAAAERRKERIEDAAKAQALTKKKGV